MTDRAAIVKMIDDHLAGSPLFLIDVLVKPGNSILVFIDSDQEVKVSDCAMLSRYIESQLNRDEDDYELRVSSAGIDHPYQFLRQYVKNVGRQVQVQLMDGSVIRGTLVKANEKSVEIMPYEKKGKKKEQEVPAIKLSMEQIKETRGIVTFD
jgi:ribosome maturation factor RimP